MFLQCCSFLLIAAILSPANDSLRERNVGSTHRKRTDATDLCTSSVSGFNFIKSFAFTCKPSEDFEFSYVLVKKSRYNVRLCLEHSSSLQVELYNSYRDKLLTFTPKPESVDSFVYECNATGIYYIRILNREGKEVSGQISLAFQKAL